MSLADRMAAQEKRVDEVSNSLHKHVTECAVMQKRVLIVGCLTLGWVVGHAPETADIVKALFKAVAQ